MKKLIVVGIIILLIVMSIPSSSIADMNTQPESLSNNDFAPPTIEKPGLGYIYIFNRLPLFLSAFDTLEVAGAIGKLTIKVSHPDIENVSRMEFYLNNMTRRVDKNPPYSWTLRFSQFPYNVVKVVAISHEGDIASTQIILIFYRILLTPFYRLY